MRIPIEKQSDNEFSLCFPLSLGQTRIRLFVSPRTDLPVKPAPTPFHSGAVYDLSYRVTLLSPSAYSSLNLTSAALNGFP